MPTFVPRGSRHPVQSAANPFEEDGLQAASRRHFLAGLSLLGAALGSPAPLWAQTGPAPKGKLGPKVRIVIPGAPRASLDDVGRALGDAMVGIGLCDEVEYENQEGKGGQLPLAYYANKYGADGNTFLIGDASMSGMAALQKPGIELPKLQPVARLTSDYLVVVVAAGSPLKTLADLSGGLRATQRQLPMAGGPAGSIDHVFAGLTTKSSGARPEDLAYLPFARRFEMADAVLGGKAAVGISAYGNFSEELASGKLRALGVSSRRTAYGIRSMREQGLDVDMTNWRAVFTGQGVAAARQADMVDAVRTAMTYELWKKTLKQSYWESSWMTGPDLRSFVEMDMKTAQLMVQLLKLKA